MAQLRFEPNLLHPKNLHIAKDMVFYSFYFPYFLYDKHALLKKKMFNILHIFVM